MKFLTTVVAAICGLLTNPFKSPTVDQSPVIPKPAQNRNFYVPEVADFFCALHGIGDLELVQSATTTPSPPAFYAVEVAEFLCTPHGIGDLELAQSATITPSSPSIAGPQSAFYAVEVAKFLCTPHGIGDLELLSSTAAANTTTSPGIAGTMSSILVDMVTKLATTAIPRFGFLFAPVLLALSAFALLLLVFSTIHRLKQLVSNLETQLALQTDIIEQNAAATARTLLAFDLAMKNTLSEDKVTNQLAVALEAQIQLITSRLAALEAKATANSIDDRVAQLEAYSKFDTTSDRLAALVAQVDDLAVLRDELSSLPDKVVELSDKVDVFTADRLAMAKSLSEYTSVNQEVSACLARDRLNLGSDKETVEKDLVGQFAAVQAAVRAEMRHNAGRLGQLAGTLNMTPQGYVAGPGQGWGAPVPRHGAYF